uniref:Uncharacterized protein n=1 Tax=Rhizophora mucronata TaxID=61149 RepID=A0A2P2J314_RHIMU
MYSGLGGQLHANETLQAFGPHFIFLRELINAFLCKNNYALY